MNLSRGFFGCPRVARAGLILALIGVTASAQTPPPGEPTKPAEKAPSPAPKSPGKLESRYAVVFDAVRLKLPEEQWELKQQAMSPRELSKALGEGITKDQKAIVAQMVDGEVLGGENFFDKQVAVVQVLRFKDQENATKYLDMVHVLTRDRFDALGKKTPGATMEISDEKLMVLGTDASKRLVIKSTTGPRTGTTFINRFVNGPIFVEVTIVAKVPEKSVDMMLTDEAIAAVKRL
jgi:hypothetical protein